MYEFVDQQIKREKINQLFDQDNSLFDKVMMEREYYIKNQFTKMKDTHPYDIIKNKVGYEAHNKHQAKMRKIDIPEYKIVKRVRG